MLTCTEGKERTLAEYEALLKQVGFSQVMGVKTPSPLDAVLAVKMKRDANRISPVATALSL